MKNKAILVIVVGLFFSNSVFSQGLSCNTEYLETAYNMIKFCEYKYLRAEDKPKERLKCFDDAAKFHFSDECLNATTESQANSTQDSPVSTGCAYAKEISDQYDLLEKAASDLVEYYLTPAYYGKLAGEQAGARELISKLQLKGVCEKEIQPLSELLDRTHLTYENAERNKNSHYRQQKEFFSTNPFSN